MSALQPLGTMVSIYSKHDGYNMARIQGTFNHRMRRITRENHASKERGDKGLSQSEMEARIAVLMSEKLNGYSESMSSIRQNYIHGHITLPMACNLTNADMAQLTALRYFFSDLTAHGMTVEQRDIADEKVATLQEDAYGKLADVALANGENIAFIPVKGGIVVA